MKYSQVMKLIALPMNYGTHLACLLLEHLGYQFCVDYGYMNAEELLRQKQCASLVGQDD